MTAPSPGPSPAPAPEQPTRLAVTLSQELCARVLAPYKPHCRYVHRAELSHARDGRTPQPDDPGSWIRLDAECGITEPCYIEATGHFNAVEYNITYNQMLYLGLAELTRLRLLPELRNWNLDDFFRHQLPDVLIANYNARFRRPMKSQAFRGWVAFCGVTTRPQRNLLMVSTRSGCSTAAGGSCEAEVTIALVNWQSA